MFYLTMHSTHFIYGYMASDIWLRTILIVRKETRCRHIGYSYRLTARLLLYAPSHIQDNTYHGLCYTSRGALAGTRNSSMGPPPWRIDPTTHRTMSERSTSELRPARSYSNRVYIHATRTSLFAWLYIHALQQRLNLSSDMGSDVPASRLDLEPRVTTSFPASPFFPTPVI